MQYAQDPYKYYRTDRRDMHDGLVHPPDGQDNQDQTCQGPVGIHVPYIDYRDYFVADLRDILEGIAHNTG
jgi:hypothetical protein